MLYQEELEINEVVKYARALLRKINPNILWIDYIPPSYLEDGRSYLIVEKGDFGVKYLEITDCNASEMVTKLLNTLDDFNLHFQFLSCRKVEEMKGAFFSLAKERTRRLSEALSFVRRAEEGELGRYLSFLQRNGAVPQFFPKAELLHQDLRTFLISYMESKEVTFLDVDIFHQWVEEEFALKKEER